MKQKKHILEKKEKTQKAKQNKTKKKNVQKAKIRLSVKQVE